MQPLGKWFSFLMLRLSNLGLRRPTLAIQEATRQQPRPALTGFQLPPRSNCCVPEGTNQRQHSQFRTRRTGLILKTILYTVYIYWKSENRAKIFSANESNEPKRPSDI